MRTLKVLSGPAAGESLGIEKEVVIGREGADLTITDPQISRRHTAVRPVDDGVEIEDLGSLNGTFVDGERLSAPKTLRSTTKIRIGDSDLEVEVTEDGLTQMAPTPIAAEAAEPTAPPARGSVRRVDDDIPAAAAVAAGAAGAAAPAAAAAAPSAVEAPPGVEPPRAEPPKAEPPTPGPPRLPTPPPGTPKRGRGLIWALLVALAVAGVIAAAIYFTQSDDEAVTTQPVVGSFRSADLTQGAKATTLAGAVNQTPGGQGSVIGRFTLKNPYTVDKARKLTGTMVFRFEDGRIDASITGTATRRSDKTTDLIITGKYLRGTREYEGVKGTFKLKSRQEVATVPTVGIGSYEGTITY